MNTRRNYFYNVLAELITTLIPLVTTPYVTRILGTDGMGAYNYVLTVASYFVLFANFGIKVYGSRCIAQVRDDTAARNRVFSGIFRLQLCLSLTVSALYAGYAILFAGEYAVIFAVFGINLLSAVMEITWLYWGMESFAPAAFSTIAVKVLTACAIFLTVKDHDDLWLYALICSLGVIAVQLILWTGVFRFVRFVSVPFSDWKRHFLPCLALLVPMLAPTLFRTMDKLMLEPVSGRDAVGFYGAAEQLQTCMLGFITGLGTVMLPRISHLLVQNKEDEAKDALSLSMQFSMFLGCAFSFGIAAAADVFVPYYYGASFADAALLTAVLSLSIVFIAWAEVVRSQYIIPHKRDRIFLVSTLVGALVNLGGNLVLIPLCQSHAGALGLSVPAAGALGALPGTVLGEAAVGVCQFCFLRKELPYCRYLRLCAVFPIAGILMFLCVKLLGQLLFGFPPLLLLAAEVCGGALVYLFITGFWYFRFRRETLGMLFSRK